MVNFSLRIIFFKATLFLIIFFIHLSYEDRQRTKRHVIFTKNSKLFFRLNGKDNVIPWVQIFAQGYTIRLNYDLPETVLRKQEFFKRDIHEEIEVLDTSSEMKLYSCVMKYFCLLIRQLKSDKICGVFCHIRKIFERSQGDDVNFFKVLLNKCDYFIDNCSNNIYNLI